MSFIPHNMNSIQQMLEELGVNSPDELFSSIPEELKLKRELSIPSGRSEGEVKAIIKETLDKNRDLSSFKGAFLGGGVYFHYVPSCVDAISSLPGFVTPYTPYQPEASQGVLTAAFEFQTMVCELTGMEVANASLYDGSTAVAEGVLMGLRISKGKRVFISQGLHPFYQEVVKTYLLEKEIEIIKLPLGEDGRTLLGDHTPGKGDVVVIQSPNFYGIVEDLPYWGDNASKMGFICIHAFAEALSLAIFKTPGDCGLHISCGEGSSFGIYPSFGGPGLGLFATRQSFLRQIPGRIAGETTDVEGRRGFVFTLSTREQHIRREKATSNVCTNVQLNALRATVYLSIMGSTLKDLAFDNASRAHALFKMITASGRIKPLYSGEFFNEFAVVLPIPASEAVKRMKEKGFLAGVPVSVLTRREEDANILLIATTEMNSDETILAFAETLEETVR